VGRTISRLAATISAAYVQFIHKKTGIIIMKKFCSGTLRPIWRSEQLQISPRCPLSAGHP
jgi:hypothetical protein